MEWSGAGELGQRSKRRPDPLPVGGQAVADDQPVEVLDRGPRKLDRGHPLQVLEGDRVTGASVLHALLCTLPGTIDAVESGDDVVGIRIGVLDGRGQQGTGERAFVAMHTCSQPGQLRGVLAVEGDVEALSVHAARLHAATRSVRDSPFW